MIALPDKFTRPVRPTFRVGDLVSYIYGGNGTGEGIIWRVRRVNTRGRRITIDPVYTVTGSSSRASCSASMGSVEKLNLLKLGAARAELDSLIRKYVAESVGLTEEEAQCSSST